MKRLICYFLLIAIVLSCVACGKASPNHEIPDRDLTVEPIEIRYSGVQIGSLTKRIRSAICRTVFLIDKTQYSSDEISHLDSYIRNTILPLMQSEGIGYDELNELVFFAEALLGTAEKSGKLVAWRMWEESYRNCIGVLGSEKTGKVFYRLTILYLEHAIKAATEQYTEHPNEEVRLHLQQLTEKKTALTDVLDQDAFATAAVFSFFTASILSDATENDIQNAFTLSHEEMRLLWIRQADHFSSHPLTAEQWRAAADIFTFLGLKNLPAPDHLTELQSALWSVVCENTASLTDISETIPSFLSLYRAFAGAVSADEIALLRQGDKDVVLQTLCRVLSRCEAPLLDFSKQFSQKATIRSDAEEEAIKALGKWETYLAYAAEREAVSAEALTATLCHSSDIEEMRCALKNYLFGIMPYITFSIFEKGSDRG